MQIPDPKPKSLVKTHFILLAIWIALLIPSLTIWKESLVWVVLMSHYAIIGTHFAGWDGARAEQKVDEQSK